MKKEIGYAAIGVFLFLMVLFLCRTLDVPSVRKEAGSSIIETSATMDKAATTTSEKTEESTKETTSTVYNVPADFPTVDLTDWSMVLVGPLHKLEKELDNEELGDLSNSYLADKRIISAYQTMAEAAKKAGFPLVIISAFRSVTDQKAVFNANVEQLENQGKSPDEAVKTTKLTFTEPGYSEHHTGLAIDVVDEYWYNSNPSQILDEKFGETKGAKWLAEHAREYGFIIRYPKDKYDITKISYEPWHLRYVGVEAAVYIEKHQLTFEEFIEQAKEVKNESTS